MSHFSRSVVLTFFSVAPFLFSCFSAPLSSSHVSSRTLVAVFLLALNRSLPLLTLSRALPLLALSRALPLLTLARFLCSRSVASLSLLTLSRKSFSSRLVALFFSRLSRSLSLHACLYFLFRPSLSSALTFPL
jgi:hypothetical protein